MKHRTGQTSATPTFVYMYCTEIDVAFFSDIPPGVLVSILIGHPHDLPCA